MLRWELIDLDCGLMRLESGTTKNRKGRLIPLVKEVTEALWQWKRWTLHRYPSCQWSVISEANDSGACQSEFGNRPVNGWGSRESNRSERKQGVLPVEHIHCRMYN